MNYKLISDLLASSLKDEAVTVEIDSSDIESSMIKFKIDYTYFGTSTLIVTHLSDDNYLLTLSYTSKNYTKVRNVIPLELREASFEQASLRIKQMLVETRLGGDLLC